MESFVIQRPVKIEADYFTPDGKKAGRALMLCVWQSGEEFSAPHWSGSFTAIDPALPNNLLGGEYELRISEHPPIPFLFTDTKISRLVGQKTTCTGNFVGKGWPPKAIFPDAPDIPTPPESDPNPVKVVTSRYGDERREAFATLREALVSLHADVEHNTAAPVSLTVPGTVFGAKPVKFNTHQIYVMLRLLDD